MDRGVLHPSADRGDGGYGGGYRWGSASPTGIAEMDDGRVNGLAVTFVEGDGGVGTGSVGLRGGGGGGDEQDSLLGGPTSQSSHLSAVSMG